jgi:flagellar basal-body rod modification protein FlgD
MIISPTSLVPNRTATTTTSAASPATGSATGTATGTAASGTTSTPPGGELGKDQFLKLLVAQMQNQDPMNPMQGDQMAAQLAQFSSLEQLQEMNTTLTAEASGQGSLLGAIQSTAAIGTIGHTVIAAGNGIEIGNGAPTSVTTDIAGAGVSATLHVYDSSGKEVGSRDLGPVSGGRQTFALGDAVKNLPDGTYTYSVDVKNVNGDPVDVTTYTTGRVSGIASGPNGLILNIGSLSVPYGSVTQILN